VKKLSRTELSDDHSVASPDRPREKKLSRWEISEDHSVASPYLRWRRHPLPYVLAAGFVAACICRPPEPGFAAPQPSALFQRGRKQKARKHTQAPAPDPSTLPGFLLPTGTDGYTYPMVWMGGEYRYVDSGAEAVRQKQLRGAR
jgi:hypothetical protein